MTRTRGATGAVGARAFLTALLIATPVAAQNTPADLLERAARAYRAAETLRAAFGQTLTSPGSSKPRMATGEFFQRGPNRFALRFSEPAGEAIVSDGEALWVYLPSTAKGQVMKMPREAGTGLDFFAQLLSAPREHYAVTTRPDEQVVTHATGVFELVPRSPSAPFTRATLWLGRDDATLWQLEVVEPSGLVRRLRFTSVRFNSTLPKGALTFTVPAGVKIVDQAAMLGGKP